MGDEYGREFDTDGNLVSVNGDDQVKRPKDDGKPTADDRVFADGQLVAGVGDPIPDGLAGKDVEVDAGPLGLAADTPEDPSVDPPQGLSEQDFSGEQPDS